MMKPTVTYFEARGRGECIRLALKLAKVDFDDVRHTHAEWPKLKESTPFGQLPMYRDDDVSLCHAPAIVNFICRKYGMMPKCLVEQAKSDMVLGCADDVVMKITAYWHAQEADKSKVADELRTTTLPEGAKKLEKLIESLGKHTYSIGMSLSPCDIILASFVELMLHSHADQAPFSPKETTFNTATLPRMMAIHSHIYGCTEVKGWAEGERQKK